MPASSRILFSAALMSMALATSWVHAQFPLRINEIRIDQPQSDPDEYFEIVGPPGFALTPFSYIVIGDGPGGNSGVVEAVVPLTGQFIGATGFFVAAEPTFTLGVPDLVTNLPFENSDNVTHLLVEGFFGASGQDLDLNDDCILDVTPWALLVDGIGVILEENPPVITECHYGPPVVGPDGAFAPGHVKRCPDEFGPFVIGAFPLGVDDTPGGPNQCQSSLRAFGLLHTPVGQAQLEYDLGRLTLGNIGATGDDGCDVEVGDIDGFFFQCEDGMDPATLPVGAFVCDTRHNPDTGASQSISFSNTGDAIEIVADFSGIGASTRRLQVLLDGEVVYDLSGHSGALDFQLDEVPAAAKCYTHGNPIFSITEYEFEAEVVVGTPSGPPVVGNRICFLPENPTSSSPLTHFRLTGAQVPEIVIIDEALLDFDFLQFRALGESHLDTFPDRIVLSNIGASGDDGVSVMDSGGGGRIELALEPETLPIGSSIEFQYEAETMGNPATSALVFQVITAGPTVDVIPNFQGLGASSYTLTLLLGENVVYSEAGRTGPAVRYTTSDGELVQAVMGQNMENDIVLDLGTNIDVLGGPTIVADRVRMRPDNPTAGNSLSWIVQRAWFNGIPSVDVVFAAVSGAPDFTRGDCNADGALGLADAIFGLGALFGPGGAMPACADACDVNDDGSLGLADMISLLSALFSQGADPAPPYPGCGVDPTAGDGLECLSFPACP